MDVNRISCSGVGCSGRCWLETQRRRGPGNDTGRKGQASLGSTAAAFELVVGEKMGVKDGYIGWV